MTERKPHRIHCVVGTRPNFVKIASIVKALRARPECDARLVHTGQHYDFSMDRVFFEELRIPEPDVNLRVGSGTGAEVVARVMLALQPLLAKTRPDLMMVVGDVNSTVAAALTASYLKIPVAHVEAGLRSFDRDMPEEINRLVVGQVSDLHFVTERDGVENLTAEGVAPERIKLVGNVMVDTLYACLDRAIPAADCLREIGASSGFRSALIANGFGFATLHRPSNVDDPASLAGLVDALVRLSDNLPIVLAPHPRTRANLVRFGLMERLTAPLMLVTNPLSYLRSLGLMREARVIITDSGGVQEETTVLGTPCVTVRKNTERPATIEEGTNTLVGADPAALEAAVADILRTGGKRGRVPKLWDGHAAERIAEEVIAYLDARSSVTAR